jgi:type VI secretion system protein VasD
MSRSLRGLLALGLLAALVGCAAPPPPPPPPTTVVLTLTATATANPDPAGQGAPVVIRVYQLASSAAFGNAEFFDLYNQDAATLKTDLVKRDDVVLAPGQSKTVTLTPTDQVKSIGVFAGYRDYSHATWRAAADVPPHKSTKLTVTAGKTGIAIAPTAGP